MPDKTTICPIMSGPASFSRSPCIENEIVLQDCLKHKCQLWITVYTTEGIRTSGCTYELGPQMVAGVLRV